MRRLLPTLLAVSLIAGATLGAKTKLISSWSAPVPAPVSFAGKKVVALVISDDLSLRMSGEEKLARELTGRGLQGVAAYRLIPKEELLNVDKARTWFQQASVEGVVAMRLVRAEKERTYVPGWWSAPSYGSFWGYYPYAWGNVYDPGYVREDMVVVIEILIYSVPTDKLLWAGMSETTNPKQAAQLIEDMADAVAKDMKKSGLVAR